MGKGNLSVCGSIMEPAYGTGLLPLNFFVGVGGVWKFQRFRLRSEYSHLGVRSCSDSGVLLRRGIELPLLGGVEGVFLALGGHHRGQSALYIGVFSRFQPI